MQRYDPVFWKEEMIPCDDGEYYQASDVEKLKADYQAALTEESRMRANVISELRESIDNGDKIMAELSLCVEKCVEQDKQIAALKIVKDECMKANRDLTAERDELRRECERSTPQMP